jgi:hypothetical protein
MSKLSAKKLGQFFAKLYRLFILRVCREYVDCKQDHKKRQPAHEGSSMFPPAA